MKQKTPFARRQPAAVSAVESLRAHEKMAALVPAAMRLAAIHEACSTILPNMFGQCLVLRYESGQLVLAATSSSIATRLKLQFPRLQDALNASGWQVNAIRLKVQPEKNLEKSRHFEKPPLPPAAFVAFAALKQSLENSPRNEHLRVVIDEMLRRQS